ncbi:hypothetical protein EJQ19_02550 [Paenibacillus whitsoniae]|uniref:Uncharacterized protein n=1 Tax=Paenibacillus whitsoniae TaxID=2496558 RepID=A0A3S0CD44_9BACL|nr:hypothetical protein EJQ19_02550 [Paenibacillus whitsoniae]
MEQVQIGDMVLAKNSDTGEMAYKEVDLLFQKEITESWNITVGNELITTTDEHPFWIHSKGWVVSKDLVVGDLFETSDGSYLAVDKIEVKEQHTTVYNFRVKDFHTYYVSNLKILTHNSNCPQFDEYVWKLKTQSKEIQIEAAKNIDFTDLSVTDVNKLLKNSFYGNPDARFEALMKGGYLNSDKMWDFPATDRGNYIELLLSRTEYKDWGYVGSLNNGYFPVVDFSDGISAVSLKSLDPRLPSYAGSAATDEVIKHLDSLYLNGKPITEAGVPINKILDLRVPKGTVERLDMEEINANLRGMQIRIREF